MDVAGPARRIVDLLAVLDPDLCPPPPQRTRQCRAQLPVAPLAALARERRGAHRHPEAISLPRGSPAQRRTPFVQQSAPVGAGRDHRPHQRRPGAHRSTVEDDRLGHRDRAGAVIGQPAAQRGDGDVEAFVRPESAGRQERLPVHDEAGPDRGDDLATRQLGGRRPRPRTDGHQDGRTVLHHHLGPEVANPKVVGRPGPQPALGVDDLRHGGHDVAVEPGRQPIEPARLQRLAAGVDEAHEVASDAGDDPVDGRTKPLVADRTGHDDLVGSKERRKVHRRRRRLDHDDGSPSIGANRCQGLDGAVEVGPPPLPVALDRP